MTFADIYARVIRPHLYKAGKYLRGWPVLGPFLRKADRRIRFGANRSQVFSRIYRDNLWGNAESRSGFGSTREHTERVRSELPLLFRRYGVRRFLDAPCGDFNWMSTVPMDGVEYIGADIVKELIERNREQFGGVGRTFLHLDLTSDSLPAADLWMCRDCLIHLSNADIWALLRNFASSQVPLVLFSTYPGTSQNVDTETGIFHPVNLTIAPFCFPQPDLVIPDYIRLPQRELALWTRETIARAMEAGNASGN